MTGYKPHGLGPKPPRNELVPRYSVRYNGDGYTVWQAGLTVDVLAATGFDTREEAEQWIKDQTCS